MISRRDALIICLLSCVLLFFQQRIWFGTSSYASLKALGDRVDTADVLVRHERDRNEMLAAELTDLKERLEAVEERARTDLGMIQKNETFYYHNRKEALTDG